MTMKDERAGSFALNFADLERETEIGRLPVEGRVPYWLSGDLIRNGPASWRVGGRAVRHWFDGLAMLHRFGFEDGEVSYANRFLRSPQYLRTRERGEFAYSEFATDPCRSIFKRLTSAFSPPQVGHNANVSVDVIDGRFVALTETPLPVEFDRKTLETVGVLRYDDDLDGTLNTPHPHTDPATGDALNTITRFSRKSSYDVFRIGKGTRRREAIASLPAEEPAYMHSFGQTERYVVLAEYPLVVNPLKMLLSGKPYAENLRWRPERPTRFLVLEKGSGELVAAREADPFFCFHHVNAFEEDGEVVVDLLAYPDASIIRKLYLDFLERPEGDLTDLPVAELRRYRIPPAAAAAGAEDPLGYEVVSDESMELPRMNERYNAFEYSYAYGVGRSREKPQDWLNQLVKADVRECASLVWREEGCYPGEPVFVAAPGARAEDDGVVLSVVLDSGKGDSFLLVLDARSFEEVARARVPHHVPAGFHGRYFGGDLSESSAGKNERPR